MKLKELIDKAKEVNYIEPKSKDMNTWSSDEILNNALYTALHLDVQVRATLDMCKLFPPLKMFAKMMLTKYIENYS